MMMLRRHQFPRLPSAGRRRPANKLHSVTPAKLCSHFILLFKSQGCSVVAIASLVPPGNDWGSLLFVNAAHSIASSLK
ncbi:unnamed protein product [Peronospora belbahrii]|uniref:Uncharacterized protein n=1 Tax=Peronospora belbahrii TaxID=622444 RepID=A0ABN8D4I4_9STRA|nr:unnamed protein product [Peronospora belbahrii]